MDLVWLRSSGSGWIQCEKIAFQSGQNIPNSSFINFNDLEMEKLILTKWKVDNNKPIFKK